MPARDPEHVPEEVKRFNAAIANERKERQRKREAEKQQKVIDEAERAKQAAAAEVRRLLEDPKASRERREAADATYRHAVAVWKALEAGEEPPPDPSEAQAEPEPDPATDPEPEPETDSESSDTGEPSEPVADGPPADES